MKFLMKRIFLLVFIAVMAMQISCASAPKKSIELTAKKNGCQKCQKQLKNTQELRAALEKEARHKKN